jgi:hypothetical protein
LILPEPEGRIAFAAITSFERRWEALKAAGTGDGAILGSLQAFGYTTRELRRRKSWTGTIARTSDRAGEMLTEALRDGLRAAGGAGNPDVIDLALVLELGYPIHRGGPARSCRGEG